MSNLANEATEMLNGIGSRKAANRAMLHAANPLRGEPQPSNDAPEADFNDWPEPQPMTAKLNRNPTLLTYCRARYGRQ